jgi:hypothetical protein
MTKAAMMELQQQIEDVRREAYAAGYAAVMQMISDATSRPPPKGPLRQRQAVGARAVRDGQHRSRSRPALAARAARIMQKHHS